MLGVFSRTTESNRKIVLLIRKLHYRRLTKAILYFDQNQ